jgi:hypothetical protein
LDRGHLISRHETSPSALICSCMALDIDVWVALFCLYLIIGLISSRGTPSSCKYCVEEGHGNESDQFLEVRSLQCPEVDLEK